MAGESGDSASRLRFKLKSVGMRKGRLQAVVLIHDDAHVHFSDTVYLDSERERLQFARQALEYLPEGVLSLPDIQKELLILYGKVQEAYEASRRHPPAEYRGIHGRLLAKGRYWRAPSHSGGRILAIVPDWFDLLRARLSQIPDEHEFEGGESGMPLANFDAWLVEEIVLDDEAGEPHIDVVVAGQLEDGEPQPPVRVSAVQFGRMDWVLRRWGARALIHPGKAQHLRAAIQALSGAVPRRVVFTHSGFRLVDGRRVFLHAGGALGPDGPVPDIDVELPAKLSRYRLPVPPADAAPAVRALLGALDVTDRRVTLPLLAAAAAAPLDSTVGPLSSVLLLGPTGSRKSSLIGLLLHLYGGSFTAKMPVTTWADTPNSLEQLAHAAKYLPLWVDDIRPPATSTERAAQEASLQRLLRGVVTRSGRGRLATDLRQERVYMPRGLVVTSAEQVPEVASTVARLLVVRVAPMNLRRLTEAQRVGPELFPAAGAAWIQFLVRNLDELATAVPERASRYRDALLRRQPLTHGGVADSAGLLHACGSIFLSFAVGVGAIEADEARQLDDELGQALAEAAAQTQALVRRSQPGTMFLDALRALLTARQVYLMWLARGRSSSPPPSEALRLGWQEGGTPHPGGIRVGWFDPADGVVLLEPAAALGAVAVYLDELYSAAPLRIDAVYNALHQQDAIARSSTGRATVTVRVDGQQMRLLALKGRALFERDD